MTIPSPTIASSPLVTDSDIGAISPRTGLFVPPEPFSSPSLEREQSVAWITEQIRPRVWVVLTSKEEYSVEWFVYRVKRLTRVLEKKLGPDPRWWNVVSTNNGTSRAHSHLLISIPEGRTYEEAHALLERKWRWGFIEVKPYDTGLDGVGYLYDQLLPDFQDLHLSPDVPPPVYRRRGSPVPRKLHQEKVRENLDHEARRMTNMIDRSTFTEPRSVSHESPAINAMTTTVRIVGTCPLEIHLGRCAEIPSLASGQISYEDLRSFCFSRRLLLSGDASHLGLERPALMKWLIGGRKAGGRHKKPGSTARLIPPDDGELPLLLHFDYATIRQAQPKTGPVWIARLDAWSASIRLDVPGTTIESTAIEIVETGMRTRAQLDGMSSAFGSDRGPRDDFKVRRVDVESCP